jgi:hypothetical protein
VNHTVDVVGKERNVSFEICAGKVSYSVDVNDVKSPVGEHLQDRGNSAGSLFRTAL